MKYAFWVSLKYLILLSVEMYKYAFLFHFWNSLRQRKEEIEKKKKKKSVEVIAVFSFERTPLAFIKTVIYLAKIVSEIFSYFGFVWNWRGCRKSVKTTLFLRDQMICCCCLLFLCCFCSS